jgi:hypothetical protein
MYLVRLENKSKALASSGSVGAERARRRIRMGFNAAQSGNINRAAGWEFLVISVWWERITTDLCHPLQEGLQPVDIALAVAVEECEDPGRGSIRSFHARPHQAWNDSLKHCQPKGNNKFDARQLTSTGEKRKAISHHTQRWGVWCFVEWENATLSAPILCILCVKGFENHSETSIWGTAICSRNIR